MTKTKNEVTKICDEPGINLIKFFFLTFRFYSLFFPGIAEMFAEDGYDLILGFRENVSAAEKFKKELVEKYDGQNVRTKYEN